MQRREAIRIFKEISKCIPDTVVNSVSLVQSESLSKEFELRMNVNLDSRGLRNVRTVVDKHGFNLKESEGLLVIYNVAKSAVRKELMA